MQSVEQADVVIVGGAFAGASTALLLRREAPELKVVIVERAAAFDRKVGEATTEISGAFLTKRLGLTHHLTHHHIVKNGLRFWFTSGKDSTFDTAGEIGAKFQVRLPTYQVDREVLDEHLLREAAKAGAVVHRPAKVLECSEQSENEGMLVTLEAAGEKKAIRARWVIDASGKAAWWGRRNRLLQEVPEHPINAIWARFTGVADLDGVDLQGRFPGISRKVQTSRSSATNHLTGAGWWCWIIPLKGGDTSVGLVYDPRIFSPPEGESLGRRLLSHLHSNPLGNELFRDAKPVEADTRAYSKLPYRLSSIAGPGWQVVGDAAGFMDPLYSSGLDYCSWTVSSAVNRIVGEARGTTVCLQQINEDFQNSYTNWLRAIYVDKYYYLGDRELMSAAYLMDLGLFFFGPVREVVRCAKQGFAQMPFCGPVDKLVASGMAFYNQRLAWLAREKMEAGVYGLKNDHHFLFVPGFSPSWQVIFRVLDGAAIWGILECRSLWARVWQLRKGTGGVPAPHVPAEPVPGIAAARQK